MPVLVGDEVVEDEEQENSQNGGPFDKLVLMVIILVLFHIGAFVSSLSPNPIATVAILEYFSPLIKDHSGILAFKAMEKQLKYVGQIKNKNVLI